MFGVVGGAILIVRIAPDAGANSMPFLLGGLALFVGCHLLPSLEAIRSLLVRKLGEGRYKGLFSLGSMLGLVVAILGYRQAGLEPVWQPPAWGRELNHAFLLVASLLLVATFAPSDLKRWIRHPMLWGVAFWALGHLLVQGDLASVVLFGGFGAWALVGIWLINRRKHPPFGPPRTPTANLLAGAAGIALFAALWFVHPLLFGVSPR